MKYATTKIYAILLPAIVLMALTGCNNDQSDAGGVSDAPSADSLFKMTADSIIAAELAFGPEGAVALGYHQFDGKTTDYSKASLDAEISRLKSYENRLVGMDSSKLSPKAYYDYRILLAGMRNAIFNFEDRGNYTINPMTYAGALDVSIYVKRNFGPLEDRLRSIIRIERNAPAIFTAARANLADSLAKPYIETAIEVAQGAAGFLQKDLLVALKPVTNDSLMKAFNVSNKLAIDQLNGYVDWLRKEKLPKAHEHYAIGKDKYSKMLLFQEDILLSPEEVLVIGLRELKKEQDAFNAAAKVIDPSRKPVEVYHRMQLEHPTAASLLPDARKNLEGIRQFLIDKKIITVPSEVRATLKETPEFARATSTASMDIPGPFEKKATEAYYYITPVDPKWTAQQQEDWLAQFNFYTTDIVSIHEAYPGHYVQFLHLNASDATPLEKIYGSYAFVEGWAHYTEKMMVDEGFGNTGDSVKAAKYRMAQAGDALLRLCRLCVSVKTHCQGMTLDEATKFFMDNWYQGEKPCRQEALRGTFDPGYLFYTVGKLEILKLREDYKAQEGANFSLQHFHDLLLDNGMPPIRLLRERLLTNKADWDKIL